MLIFSSHPSFMSIPVMFIKPYKSIPRFAVGFSQFNQEKEPLRYHRPLSPESLREVTVPFSGTTVTVPGDHIKPIKNSNLSNFKKMKIEKFTIDHVGMLEQSSLIMAMCAKGLRDTLPKTEVLNLILSLMNVFPSVVLQGEPMQFNCPVFTKVELIGLRHIVPIVMSSIRGLLVNLQITELSDPRSSWRPPPLNPPEELVITTSSTGRSRDASGGPPPMPTWRPTSKYPTPMPTRRGNGFFQTYEISILATAKEQKATFDGGPLNISVPDVQSKMRPHSDAKSYLINMLGYHIKGDTICVE